MQNFFLRWTRILWFFVSLLLISGCGKPSEEALPVAKVGIIASMTGPGRTWGETTYNTAKVIADYYNDYGGLLVNGVRYRIEIVLEDDQLDPNLALDAAHRLVYEEKVQGIIGPLGDDAVVRVAPILDLSNIVFLHYGFSSDLLRENSPGILGSPISSQSLHSLYRYLRESRGVRTITVLANDTQEGVHQKIIAEDIALEEGLDVKHFAQLDVMEESLNFDLKDTDVSTVISNALKLKTDAILLSGLAPDNFATSVELLRTSGYEGLIIAQNTQDVNLLSALGDTSDKVIFFGGFLPESGRSEYYEELKNRLSKLSADPSVETDVKLYAMETVLRMIQYTGIREDLNFQDPLTVYDSFEYMDPFIIEERIVRLVGEEDFGVNRQVSVPLIISEMRGGAASVLRIEELPN